jgi:hypothetical protein
LIYLLANKKIKVVKKMIKKTLTAKIAAIALLISSMPALAADYSSMSNDELSSMKGTMQNASAEEREAFKTEWQKRMQSMTPEERSTYSGRPEGASGTGSGSGQGKGYRGGKSR